MTLQDILAKIRQYPIVAVGLIVTLFFGVIVYLRSEEPALRKTVEAQRQATYEVFLKNQEQSTNIENHNRQLQEQIAIVEANLMDREQTNKNYRVIFDLEEKTGVFQSLVPSPTLPKMDGIEYPALTLYEPITWNGSVEGEFSKVLLFFHELRSSPYFVRIERFDLTSIGTATNTTMVKANIKFDFLGKKTAK